MTRPWVIVINGLPCTGKTTLAERIARRLGFALIAKDDIKEALFERWGWRDRRWSRQLSWISYSMMYERLQSTLAQGGSCILEANFKAPWHAFKLNQLRRRFAFKALQVLCETAGPVLVERFTLRAASGTRHPGHMDHLLLEELKPTLLAGRLTPLAVKGRLLKIDTTDLVCFDHDAWVNVVADAVAG